MSTNQIFIGKVIGLCRSLAGSHFYRTEYDIWADFGPVGNSEKKIGP